MSDSRVQPGHAAVLLGKGRLSHVLCECSWRSHKSPESSALAQHDEHVALSAPARTPSPE